ncbi:MULTISPECIES: phosphate uptake regulator PhoU [Halobacterium]|uniref:PhoU domain protein n=4 Tax=Halobacterium salinarum TaxID=2242 RepID=Q9HS09_HALSA|nr:MULTISPECIES: phosphate uptake regulator PhoU [Halobacterium]AAG18999.1 phosphate regulatory protein homolog [Halobacterium salinarum NRC-1]MBB6089832.1 phosphate transport system protein [Halobacterium salinarum]MCF2164077.1 phosphate uptake regulator PhoU [Halobacterium salinarum]MCF2167847.1 phosphate uptake regulator PhoU [Halobacterium salinarum]MCF2239310.1 phosphate uptake regulator PhoU [Halobacterium salinarum]
MERRKVQVTGGSTFTVSIPKDWARDHSVEAGDEVGFHPDSGSLLLTPIDDTDTDKGTLTITDMHGEELMRAVMTMYVSGFDVLALEAESIDPDQRRVIRDATQGLVGLEVLEETSQRVVIQDLLDSSELSIHNAVRRMHLIAVSMLEDAVTALATRDPDIARDVTNRDDDVDRLWYVVSRIFRGALRSPTVAQEIGITREVAFDYHSSARQLERVADHATKIATATHDLNDDIPEDVVDALETLQADATDIIETAMDALFADTADEATALATQARAQVRDIDDQARDVDDRLHGLTAHHAQHLGLVVDSLSRSADYGGNIAETALQKAAPTPNP